MKWPFSCKPPRKQPPSLFWNSFKKMVHVINVYYIRQINRAVALNKFFAIRNKPQFCLVLTFIEN